MLKTKQFTLLFSCFLNLLLVASLPVNAGAGPQFMPPQGGMPMGPGMMPPGGMPPMGAMGAPSEEELEEALKFIQYLEENDPEQLKQLEQLGQQMINQMSDDDLGMLSEAFNIAPDELREEAAKGLADLEAQHPTQPSFEPEPKQETPAAPQPVFSKAGRKQAKTVIEGLIDTLSSLRQKSASSRETHELIRSWREELRDLMYFLKLVDEKKYHERLSLAENKNLFNTLSTLYGTLKTQEPKVLTPDELEETDNPYDLLGIKWTAPAADIEAAYTELSEKFDPKKVEQRLTVEGLTGKDLKYAVKSAKLSYEAIEDAYEQLSDSKMKQQVDRELKTELDQRKLDKQQATQALEKITEALSTAVYSGQLISELEKFLQTYLPEAAKQKKEMDAAEKKHVDAQKKLAAQKPTTTPGSRFEPSVQMPGGSYNNYDYYDDFPYSDYYDGYDYNDYPDYGFDDYSPYGQEPQKEAPSAGAEDGKEKDESGDKFTGTEKHAGKTAKASAEIDKRTIKELTKDVSDSLGKFETSYVQHSNFLTKELSEYMHSAAKPEPTKNDQEKAVADDKDDSDDDFGPALSRMFDDGDIGSTSTSTTKSDATTKETTGFYPPDYSKNEKLKSFYSSSKIKELNEDMNKLSKKLRLEGSKALEANVVEWSKLEDKTEKNLESFAKLEAGLEQALSGDDIAPNKIGAHKEHIDAILTNLKGFGSGYDQIKTKMAA